MENSAHTWRLKIFKLVFVYAHRLFCYPPAQKKIFARAKIFFLSPQSSGSRTGGYLLSCPTLCKHWRVDFLSQPPFFSNFSIPAALAAHRYSWTSMTNCVFVKVLHNVFKNIFGIDDRNQDSGSFQIFPQLMSTVQLSTDR